MNTRHHTPRDLVGTKTGKARVPNWERQLTSDGYVVWTIYRRVNGTLWRWQHRATLIDSRRGIAWELRYLRLNMYADIKADQPRHRAI